MYTVYIATRICISLYGKGLCTGGYMCHSGAVPCGSGARQCDAVRCCVSIRPHGFLVLGLMTKFRAASC